MPSSLRSLILLCVVAAACHDPSRTTDLAAVTDSTPPRVQLVPATAGVDLEVLDWGGSGPPLVFLAGFGNSAHVFTGFAPRFRDTFRVIGITRRGFGGSTLASGGYQVDTLVADLRAVLGALGAERPIVVAHSFGGAELNGLLTVHPDVARAAIYLDGGFDFAELYADTAWVGTPIPRPPRAVPGDTTLAGLVAYFAEMVGPGYPAAELESDAQRGRRVRQTPSFAADSLPSWLMRGTPPVRREAMRTPALAIYGVPATVQEKYPWYERTEPEGQRRAERRFAVEDAALAHQRARFGREVPGGRVVEIAGGRHYVFLTHPGEVEREIRAFVEGLARE